MLPSREWQPPSHLKWGSIEAWSAVRRQWEKPKSVPAYTRPGIGISCSVDEVFESMFDGQTCFGLRVVDGMLVVLPSNFGQVDLFGAVFLHVFHASSSKPLSSHRGRFDTDVLGQGADMAIHRIHSVVVALEEYELKITQTNYQRMFNILCQSGILVSSSQSQQQEHNQQFHQPPTVGQGRELTNQSSNCCLHCRSECHSFLVGIMPVDHSRTHLERRK